MIIANPIYDVVFKYLLEDIEIARELLSTILGEKIITLSVRPQETLVKSESGAIKIFHLDFKAVIDLEDGLQKTVLIELQKAKKSYDILRFRKYLGENYTKEEIRKDSQGNVERFSLEIVTIYLLGFVLEGVNVPILKVGRKFIDVVNEKEVVAHNEFIDNLTHECFTIQIPRLKLNAKTALEQILAVFSQEYVTTDLHIIDYPNTSTLPLVKKIVKRLSKAAANDQIKKKMDAEDSIERLISRELNEKLKIQKEKHLVEIEKIIQEKDDAIEKERKEKDDAIKEKDDAIEKERKEKHDAIKEKDDAIEKERKEKDDAIEKERKEKDDLQRELEELKKKLDSML